jgi:hypothetical protein
VADSVKPDRQTYFNRQKFMGKYHRRKVNFPKLNANSLSFHFFRSCFTVTKIKYPWLKPLDAHLIVALLSSALRCRACTNLRFFLFVLVDDCRDLLDEISEDKVS